MSAIMFEDQIINPLTYFWVTSIEKSHSKKEPYCFVITPAGNCTDNEIKFTYKTKEEADAKRLELFGLLKNTGEPLTMKISDFKMSDLPSVVTLGGEEVRPIPCNKIGEDTTIKELT